MSEENGGDAGQNGAFLSDPVDVIIEKLLRYVLAYPKQRLFEKALKSSL
jgi:hypothetical protein